MRYFFVERQPTIELNKETKEVSSDPAFLTLFDKAEKEFIPVFLSRFHACLYISTAETAEQLLGDFKLVSEGDITLDGYRESCKTFSEHLQKHMSCPCKVVLDLVPDGKLYNVAYSDKPFNFCEVLLNGQKVEEEISEFLTEPYQVIVEKEKLSDEEILEKVSGLIGKDSPIKKLLMRNITNSKEFKDEKGVTPKAHEHYSNVGNMNVFILKNPDGTLWVTMEGGKRYTPLFVNKLDALIYSLSIRQMDNYHYDIVTLTSDKTYFDVLKMQHRQGEINFRIVYGFAAISNPLGAKWVKYEDSQTMPAMVGKNCDLSEVENGFNVDRYFHYVEGKQEREEAIASLIKTNLTPESRLMESADRFMSDMQNNLIKTDPKNPAIYHRLIFVG